MTNYIFAQYAPSRNGMYMFKKEADIKEAGKGVVNIFASTRYILYINGKYICEGPCRSHEKVRYYDSVECEFEKGKNLIEVKVMHTVDYFTTVYKTAVPMLVMEATIGDESVVTDETWSCTYLGEYKLVRYEMKTLPPFEVITKGEKNISVPVEKMERCIFQENGNFISGGAAFNFILKKRPIPMIYPQSEVELKPFRSGDGFMEFDAKEYMTAKVKFDIEKNSNVKIIYSECFEFPDGKKRRDDTSGFLKGYYDEVSTDNEDFQFEPFWYRAFRYIRIEGEGVKSVKVSRINYPFDITGNFECSHESYNQMYDISINTLLCCCHEIISDCPYYEQQQYQFDSSVQLAAIYGITRDKALVKKCISEFAVSQQPNGLLLSTYPASWALQMTPGYSLMWIMMLRFYLENTGDVEFVSQYVGVVDGILGYFGRIFERDGYISPTRHWNFMDWVPGWENKGGGSVPLKDDEAHTLYNMYYACALKDAAYICNAIKRYGIGEEYSGKHEKVTETINRLCYDTKKGMYKDGSVTETYSMHTTVWAILSDTVTGEEAIKLLEKLYEPNISKCTFAMNFYLLRALEKCGMYEKAFPVFDEWKMMLDNGCTTWCETPQEPRSECHGWGCAPLYDFPKNILGVRHGGHNEIIIKPNVGNLTYAKGTVPTIYGDVKVEWTAKDGKFNIEIEAEEGLKKILVMPNGTEYVFCNEKYIKITEQM